MGRPGLGLQVGFLARDEPQSPECQGHLARDLEIQGESAREVLQQVAQAARQRTGLLGRACFRHAGSSLARSPARWYLVGVTQLPDALRWLFWEIDPTQLDLEAAADYIMARVLEFGRSREIRWLLEYYGPRRIHKFLREVGHPEISRRTLAFWRVFLGAETEKWSETPSFRNSGPPWAP